MARWCYVRTWCCARYALETDDGRCYVRASVSTIRKERVQRALVRESNGEEGTVPFVFVVNLYMPSGNSTSSGNPSIEFASD